MALASIIHARFPADLATERVWTELQNAMDHIFTEKKMLQREYMLLYTLVYDYCTTLGTTCTSVKQTRLRRTPLRAERAELNEPKRAELCERTYAELHERMREKVDKHLCESIIPYINNESDDIMLQNYVHSWNQFCLCSKVLDGICVYINRDWIRVRRELQENDQKRAGDLQVVLEVYRVCLLAWKARVFGYFKARITASILRQIQKHREGEQVDQIISSIVDSYVALGVRARNDSERFFSPTLDVYKEELETPLLAETERYYAAESEENSIEQRLCDAVVRIDDERARCRAYLHATTEQKLRRTMENVLIAKHLERFHSEFQDLLNQGKIDDLKCMYQLFSRVESGLEQRYQLVEKHARQKGLESIANLGRDALEDSARYVQVILEEHCRCTILVKDVFMNEVGFKSAVDRALSAFVNKNYATENTPQGTNKSAEHLARFADLIMKKGSKIRAFGDGVANCSNIEQDPEAALNQVLTVFRYLEDKDVFEQFYSRSFAKRLIFGLSESDSSEETMISRLKESCGYAYASKLQRMYTDYTNSKNLNERFKQFAEDSRRRSHNAFKVNGASDFASTAYNEVKWASASTHEAATASSGGSNKNTIPTTYGAPSSPVVNCQVLVAAAGQWPLRATQSEFVIPEELDQCATLFQAFYDKQHNSRKLVWAHSLGRCDLQTNCYERPYFLTCNLPQTIILLQFNGAASSMTYRQLLENTKLDDKNARQSLQILALKAHLLNCFNVAAGVDGNENAESCDSSNKLVVVMEDITAHTIVKLNESYKNKKLRLNLSVMVRDQEKKEQEQTYKDVGNDRLIVVQAAIVRVMKARKTLKHQQLVAETFEQVSRSFKPLVPVVKKAISALMDREFIKRDDAQHDLYHYVA